MTSTTETPTIEAYFNSHQIGMVRCERCNRWEDEGPIYFKSGDDWICWVCAEELMPELAEIYLPENEEGERCYDLAKFEQVMGKIMPAEDLAEILHDLNRRED